MFKYLRSSVMLHVYTKRALIKTVKKKRTRWIYFLIKIPLKIKKLYLTWLSETDNIKSVELLLRHKKYFNRNLHRNMTSCIFPFVASVNKRAASTI